MIFNAGSLPVPQVLYWEETWGIQTERARVQSVSNPHPRRHPVGSVSQAGALCLTGARVSAC